MRHLDRCCLVVGLPGYGQRRQRGDDLSPPVLAATLLANLDALHLSPVVLVGHSSSCQIVAEAAAAGTHSVAGLVLIGPTTDPAARAWVRLTTRWLRTAGHERLRTVPSLIRQYARTGPVAMFRAMATCRRHDIAVAVAATSAPLLVLRGARDRIATAPWVRHVAACGEGHASTLPAGAHLVLMTHGSLVAAKVRKYLDHHAL